MNRIDEIISTATKKADAAYAEAITELKKILPLDSQAEGFHPAYEYNPAIRDRRAIGKIVRVNVNRLGEAYVIIQKPGQEKDGKFAGCRFHPREVTLA